MTDIEMYVGLSSILCTAIIVTIIFNSRKNYSNLVLSNHKIEDIFTKNTIENILLDLATKENKLLVKIRSGGKHLSTLKKNIKLVSPEVKMIKGGLYPPIFKFDDSDKLKNNIQSIRKKQIKLVNSDDAVDSMRSLSWLGDSEKGAKILTATRRLFVMAFNAEFDSIRKQMRFSTYDKAQEKLAKLDEQLERLGETVNCSISLDYFTLKSAELVTWHKELLKKESIKTEQKKQKETIKLQNKQDSFDSEKLDDEIEYKQSDLKKAQQLVMKMIGSDRLSIESEIEALKNEIEKLEEKFSREISQAQITRSGYIYVISNIGSFGEGVVKIGMTRRLEPMDRVNELGDASVPFKFDVHALTFVKDAPKIERTLHDIFNDRRVNTANHRKEFFRVKPEEVKDALLGLGFDTDWYFDIEAKEYHESQLLREALGRTKEKSPSLAESLPTTI